MILNRVVSATFQKFGDFCPAVAEGAVGEKEHPLFMLAPLLLLDVGVEMVVPSFPALLAYSACMEHRVPGRFSAMVVHF
jgi:hypothetical protein